MLQGPGSLPGVTANALPCHFNIAKTIWMRRHIWFVAELVNLRDSSFVLSVQRDIDSLILTRQFRLKI